MPSHSKGPGIWLSVWRFLLTHWLYERAGEVLARLRRLAWTFAARIGNKYQIRLTRSMSSLCIPGECREKIFEESEVTHCQCHMVYLVGKFSLSLCLLYDQGVIMWGTKIEVNIWCRWNEMPPSPSPSDIFHKSCFWRLDVHQVLLLLLNESQIRNSL